MLEISVPSSEYVADRAKKLFNTVTRLRLVEEYIVEEGNGTHYWKCSSDVRQGRELKILLDWNLHRGINRIAYGLYLDLREEGSEDIGKNIVQRILDQ